MSDTDPLIISQIATRLSLGRGTIHPTRDPTTGEFMPLKPEDYNPPAGNEKSPSPMPSVRSIETEADRERVVNMLLNNTPPNSDIKSYEPNPFMDQPDDALAPATKKRGRDTGKGKGKATAKAPKTPLVKGRGGYEAGNASKDVSDITVYEPATPEHGNTPYHYPQKTRNSEVKPRGLPSYEYSVEDDSDFANDPNMFPADNKTRYNIKQIFRALDIIYGTTKEARELSLAVINVLREAFTPEFQNQVLLAQRPGSSSVPVQPLSSPALSLRFRNMATPTKKFRGGANSGRQLGYDSEARRIINQNETSDLLNDESPGTAAEGYLHQSKNLNMAEPQLPSTADQGLAVLPGLPHFDPADFVLSNEQLDELIADMNREFQENQQRSLDDPFTAVPDMQSGHAGKALDPMALAFEPRPFDQTTSVSCGDELWFPQAPASGADVSAGVEVGTLQQSRSTISGQQSLALSSGAHHSGNLAPSSAGIPEPATRGGAHPVLSTSAPFQNEAFVPRDRSFSEKKKSSIAVRPQWRQPQPTLKSRHFSDHLSSSFLESLAQHSSSTKAAPKHKTPDTSTSQTNQVEPPKPKLRLIITDSKAVLQPQPHKMEEHNFTAAALERKKWGGGPPIAQPQKKHTFNPEAPAFQFNAAPASGQFIVPGQAQQSPAPMLSNTACDVSQQPQNSQNFGILNQNRPGFYQQRPAYTVNQFSGMSQKSAKMARQHSGMMGQNMVNMGPPQAPPNQGFMSTSAQPFQQRPPMTGYGQNTSSQFNPSQQPGTNFSTPNFVPPPHPQAASAFVNTHTSQLQQPGNPFIQQSSQQTNNQNTRQQQPFGMPYNQQSTPQNQYNRLPTPQNQYSQPSIQQSQNTQTTYLPPQRQSSQENNRAELSRFDRTSNQDVRVQAASFMASGGSQRDYPAANTNGNQMGNQMGNQPGYNNTGLMEASQPSGVGVIQMMGRNGEIPGQTRSQMSTSQSFGQQQGPQQYMVHNGLPPGNGQAIFGPYTNLSSANTIAQLAAVTPPVLMEAAASALPMAQIQGQHQRGASSGSGTAEMNLRGGEAPAEMSQMIKIEPGVEDVDMGGMVQGTPSVANSAANPIDVDALQLQVIQMQQEIARLRQSGQAGQGGQSGQPSQ